MLRKAIHQLIRLDFTITTQYGDKRHRHLGVIGVVPWCRRQDTLVHRDGELILGNEKLLPESVPYAQAAE